MLSNSVTNIYLIFGKPLKEVKGALTTKNYFFCGSNRFFYNHDPDDVLLILFPLLHAFKLIFLFIVFYVC